MTDRLRFVGRGFGPPARRWRSKFALAVALVVAVGLSYHIGITPLPRPTSDAEAATLTPTTFTKIVKERKWAVVHIISGSRAERLWEHGPWPPEFFGKDAPLREHLDRLLDLEIRWGDPGSEAASGFLIDSEGHILTSYGVARHGEDFKVTLLGGEVYEAILVGKDARRHVALLKIEAGKQLPFIPLGDSDLLEVGQWVMALSNPLGSGEMLFTGVINATRHPGPRTRRTEGDAREYIATDAASHPETWGCPLLNLRGEAVGLGIGGPRVRGTKAGLAVPINVVKAILDDLRLRGEVPQGWLGITIQPITPELARWFNLSEEDQRVLVASVEPGSPADLAGLASGDILVTFDGREIGEPEDLVELVADTPPGKDVIVEAIRQGERVSLTVTVGDAGRAARPRAPMTEIVGLTVRDTTQEVARRLGMLEPRGVAVVAVERDSPADRAGLREGDVIIEVNRTEVADRKAYEELLAETEGESVLLLVKRKKGARFVALQLG